MPPLELQLIGPLTVRRGGEAVELPGSRKIKALLAYLVVAAHPAGRSSLCDLLWDVADDPRGELRWCLSKLRSLIGECRLITNGDTIAVDVTNSSVDVAEIVAAHQHGFRALPVERLRSLADRFAGDFLDGLAIDRNPAFDTWLLSQRRRFRDIHAALLEHLVQRLCGEEARLYLDRWIRIAPFDLRPHELLLRALASEGRIREGEEHLEATIKLFRSEDLEAKPLREIWRMARAQADETASAVPATPAPVLEPAASGPDGATDPRRASIAIMPFVDNSPVVVPGGPADALVHDVITRLAKLRTLRVIAQGTVFALKGRQHSAEEISRMLGVDYVVNGTFLRRGDCIALRVELVETRTGGVIWADLFDSRAADIFALLDDLGLRIVIAVEREVEALESSRAMLKPPGSLDAWESHHRGLWHAYRFTRADNAQAQHFFKTAVDLDPTFSRARSGLSFTHWQNAFQGWADRATETELAYRTASQSMMIDDRDPASRWALGRALWLRGRTEQSVLELEQAAELSPNFALAYYCLAFIQAQSGDPAAAVAAADRARELSPFDPLLFGMLASRAMALVRLGEFDQAADWAVRAATRPNAHVHILAIAALSLSLAGRVDEARSHVSLIREGQSNYGLSNFFSAFHIQPADMERYQDSARRIGLA